MASSIVVAGKNPPDVAFGGVMDLALASTGLGSTEICEACSTINLGSARFCKACSCGNGFDLRVCRTRGLVVVIGATESSSSLVEQTRRWSDRESLRELQRAV